MMSVYVSCALVIMADLDEQRSLAEEIFLEAL
jgi:hypothetical protein